MNFNHATYSMIRRLPILEEGTSGAGGLTASSMNAVLMGRYPRWFVLGHIESQQCELASCMITAAKGTCERGHITSSHSVTLAKNCVVINDKL